jgi:hypothetical protein
MSKKLSAKIVSFKRGVIMKTYLKRFIPSQLPFFLIILFFSCSTKQEDRIKVLEQAFNINNIDSAFSHYTDNIVFEIDAFNGSGKQALRHGAEWDSIVNTHLSFSDIKIIGDSVICKCTEENDLSKLLGIGNGFYDPVIFVFKDGLIRYMKFEKTSESQNAYNAAFGSLIKWASREKSSRLKELMPEGKFMINAESANGWLVLAQEWREAKSKNR